MILFIYSREEKEKASMSVCVWGGAIRETEGEADPLLSRKSEAHLDRTPRSWPEQKADA